MRNLAKLLPSLFEGGSGSDVTIRCGRREWKLHSGLLSIRCPFFRAACQGPFQVCRNTSILPPQPGVLVIPKADAIQEAQTRIVEMNDDDGYALDSMLMFLYTGEYGYSLKSWHAETGAPSSNIYRLLVIKYHIEVVLLADKYDVPDLKELATLCATNNARDITAEDARDMTAGDA